MALDFVKRKSLSSLVWSATGDRSDRGREDAPNRRLRRPQGSGQGVSQRLAEYDWDIVLDPGSRFKPFSPTMNLRGPLAAQAVFVMEVIVPRLATALGKLHRAPDKNAGWVDDVLRAFKSDRPDGHARLRQRLGLAKQLAHLAPVPDEDRAAMTVGLFFAALVDGSPPCEVRGAPSPWIQYLLGNEDWLASSLRLAQLLEIPEPSDSMVVELARVAVIFDTETLTRRSRPVHVLESIREAARTPDAERVVQLLWSEAGQQLCHEHVREQGRQYTLEASDIKEQLDLLKPAPAPHAAARMEAPIRLLGAFRASREGRSEPERGVAALHSETFERRRRGLRSASGPADPSEASAWETRQPRTREQLEAGRADDAVSNPDAEEAVRIDSTARSTRKEEAQDSSINNPISPESLHDMNLAKRLEGLRVQLRRLSKQ